MEEFNKLEFRANEKKDRNIAIYQDRLSGLSWTALTKKYDLTVKTIYIIIKRMEEKLTKK
jgi:Mor family transcriptional regulator